MPTFTPVDFDPFAAQPKGLLEPGNIDIHNRPIVHNPDGSISTVRSISVGTDRGEVLIPTVVGDRVVSNDDAIRHYQQTGENLGYFDNADDATVYAKALHEEQAKEYLPKSTPAPKLTPVDYDPFASADFSNVQGGAETTAADEPSLLQRIGATLPGLGQLVTNPVEPVVEGLKSADLMGSLRRGSASALASTLHTGADVVDQAMLPTRMLYGDNPLGVDKLAAQSLAVEKEINADRQAAQAATPRPGLGDLIVNPVEGVRKAAAYYGNVGAESVPMMALALATRNPELGSALMGATTGAQEYTDLRSQGVSRPEAAAAGALTGATEKIGESIGLPAVMGKAGAGTLRRAVATEGGQEGLTQLMQQYIDDQATGNKTSLKDQLLGALDAAVVGGALGGGGHAVVNIPELAAAITGKKAGTPPALPTQAAPRAPEAAGQQEAAKAEPNGTPTAAAPATDDLDTMLNALLAGREEASSPTAPVAPAAPEAAAVSAANLGDATAAPAKGQDTGLTMDAIRSAMERARMAGEAAQNAKLAPPAAAPAGPEQAPPVAPEPAPVATQAPAASSPATTDDRASIEALRNEIGWETRGGQMIRGGEVNTDISSGAGFGRTDGEVIGRTPWVGKPGLDGESNFWRMRPEQGGKISEKQAHVALDKYAAGQPLKAKEQRFIDYARGVAKQYDDAFEADRVNFARDQADMAEADRMQAAQELRAHQADISQTDDGEALTLAQWVRRAHDAGVPAEQIIDATWDGSTAEQTRRLSRHIADQETNRGTDTRATSIGREGGTVEDQARPPATGADLTEPRQDFRLEAEQPAARAEPSRPEVTQRGMFAEPTATEAKDAQRNGLNGGRADTGDGGLFDGKRPEQTRIDESTDSAEAARQLSRDVGNEDADRLGLRDAVSKALGPVADRVEYLHGYEGLPEKMRRGVESRNALGRKGVTAAMYSPDTGRVFIFTQVTKTPARAVWHAAHEIAGHEGLRTLLGDRIDPALNIARQNPTVKALADEIYSQRKIADQMAKSGKTHADGVLLATEEALAELAAAVRTGDYAHIGERYGVDVPQGVQASVKAAIANFLKRLKAMIDDLFGKHVFTDEDVRSLLDAAFDAAQRRASGQPTASVERPDGSSALEQVVFHGTPHTVDKFSLQKIGTGEGAQAYGWGMYFAGRKEIAEHYREKLSAPVAPDMYVESRYGRWQIVLDDGSLTGMHFSTKAEAEARLRALTPAKRGNLYRVEVPEDSDLLDWDKPLSEQPEKIRDALAKIDPDQWSLDGEDYDANERGQAIYHRLGSPKTASEALNAAGIPGLRYLDGQSRRRPLRDVKREFLAELPEDASIGEVEDKIGTGTFSPKNDAVLKALVADDWLGFDFPAQALSAALGGELGNYDASPALRQAVNAAREGGSHNYVIWDEAAIGEPQSALDNTSGPDTLESTDYTPEQKDFMRKAGMSGAVDERTAIKRALDGLREKAPHPDADAFRQGAIDKFHGLKRAVDEKGDIAPEDNPYLAAEMIQTASTMEAILRFGAPELHQGALRVKRDVPGLLDALTPVRDQMPQWLGWMVARRAKVLQAQGRENALSDTDIQAGLSLATGHETEFKEAALGYLKLKNAILDLAEQTGIIDPEARKAWDHAEYIPFYRDMDAGFSGPGTRQGLANQSSGIRTLKGGESPLKDPLGNIIANFTRLVDSSMKNRATLLAIDQLGAPYFRKAPLAVKAETIPLDQVKKHLLEQGVDKATIAGMPADALKGVARMLAVKAPEGEDIVRVMRGGKAEYYHVDDPLLLRSLTAFNEGGTHWSIKPLVWFKQLLTAGATATPDFLIRNALRDTGEASVTSKDRFVPVVDTVRGAIDSFRESELAQDLMMAGAAFHGGLFHTGNNEDTAKAIKRALRKHGLTDSAVERYVRTLINPKRLWDVYRSVSEATEMGSRVSLARKRLTAGATPVEAAHEAKDFLNFQRRGDDSFVQAFTKMIPFLNARLQGADRLYRVGTTKGRRGKVAMRLAYMAMLTTLLYWWNQEEHKDAYDEIPDWDKDANWHIAPGTDHHLRIPKPFELGLVGGTVPERLYGALRYQLTGGEEGDRGVQSWDSFMRGLGSALGINPIPQAAMPIVEDIANKSLYFGTPIESMGDRYKAPSDRFGPTTSPTMRAASKGMAALFGEDRTMSPKRLEHFWTGYTAGMGRYLLDGADWVVRKLDHAPEQPSLALRDFPLVGTVARGGGPARSTRYVDEFYDLAEQAKVRSGAVKDALHNGDTTRAARIEKEWGWLIGQRQGSKRAKEGFMHGGLREINRVRDQLSAISKDNAKIYADRAMSGEAKRKALDANLEKRNELVRKFVRRLREAERKSRG